MQSKIKVNIIVIEGVLEEKEVRLLKQARSLIQKVQKEAAEFPAMDSNHYADILSSSIDSLTMALELDKIDRH